MATDILRFCTKLVKMSKKLSVCQRHLQNLFYIYNFIYIFLFQKLYRGDKMAKWQLIEKCKSINGKLANWQYYIFRKEIDKWV